MDTFFARTVNPEDLSLALEVIQRFDSMGGNEVTRVDMIYDKYLIVFKRKNDYPFVIDGIDKFLGYKSDMK